MFTNVQNEYEKKWYKSQIFIISIWFAHYFFISVNLIFYFRFSFRILSSESTFSIHLHRHFSPILFLSAFACHSLFFFQCVVKCMSASWCKLFKDYPSEKKIEHGKNRVNLKSMNHSNHTLYEVKWNKNTVWNKCWRIHTYCWMWIFNYILEIEMKTSENIRTCTIWIESWAIIHWIRLTYDKNRWTCRQLHIKSTKYVHQNFPLVISQKEIISHNRKRFLSLD